MKIVLGLFLLLLALLLLTGWFDAANNEIFEYKIARLLAGQEKIETTASKLFGIKENEFICLVSGWDLEGRPNSSIKSDYSALMESGLTVGDIPSYKTSLYYDVLMWDFSNNFVVKFSENKIRRIRIVTFSQLELNNNSVGLDYGYGCYTYSKKLIIHASKNNRKPPTIQFWESS